MGLIMLLHSDLLDWVIKFCPYFTLPYIENHGPIKLYVIRKLDTVSIALM